MATAPAKHEYAFQAEIQQVLHLLAHSLYQSKDIAIRELISNASDALDKMRHVALTESGQNTSESLEIVLTPDRDKGTLTIADNGIGMNEEELVKNLGTIAKSGSLEFLNQLTGDEKKDVKLIGQFGVGFYSAFMLGENVEVRTRSYRDEQGWIWESSGAGHFSIRSAEGIPRGTQVVLHLKPTLKEEYTNESRLRQIIRTYSSFIPHPIKIEDKIVNDTKAIWVEPKSQITPEDYEGFYQHLSHHAEEKPIWSLHYSTDSPIQFHALLYCPSTNPERLGFGRLDHGLHLCAKRVLVQNDCRELVPEYLRFLVGIVDSEDLPLNVSRETLQDNTVFQKIRRLLVKKVIERLGELSKEEPEKFRQFHDTFGNMIREGVGTDFENRQKLAALMRFPSTKAEGKDVVSLDEYIARCQFGQKKIYYLGGADQSTSARHPHLEVFHKRGLEVLLLPEPIDEWALTALHKYQDFELQSIDAADLSLPDAPEIATPAEPISPGFEKVLEIFRKRLGGRVREVKVSDRLVDSPSCLTSPEGAPSAQMSRLMMFSQKEYVPEPRIFEVNPRAALIRRLADLAVNPEHEAFIGKVGDQLLDNALLSDGLLMEREEMAARVVGFMEEASRSRSSIITG